MIRPTPCREPCRGIVQSELDGKQFPFDTLDPRLPTSKTAAIEWCRRHDEGVTDEGT